MAAKIRISNITFIQKKVKDYAKPIRFTLTLSWEDLEGRSHGVDIIGCVAGVGMDGKAEWRGPGVFLGRKLAYVCHFETGTYEAVLRALVEGGHLKYRLQDWLKPIPAEEEGLVGEIDVA